MNIKLIKLLVYLLLMHTLHALPLAHVNTMPKDWEDSPNLSVCEFFKGKLLTEKIIKGDKLDKAHRLLGSKNMTGKYLIIHDKINFSGLYKVEDNKVIYVIRELNQTFYLIYNLDEVKRFFRKKEKVEN